MADPAPVKSRSSRREAGSQCSQRSRALSQGVDPSPSPFWQDADNRHHAVILVFENVAVIDEVADIHPAKIHSHGHAGIGSGSSPIRDVHRVEELPLLWWHRDAVPLEQ